MAQTLKLFFISSLFFSNITFANICQSYFNQKSHTQMADDFWAYWNKNLLRFKKNPAFIHELSKILGQIESLQTQELFFLDKPITNLKIKGSKYITAALLYQISLSPTGRDLIQKLFYLSLQNNTFMESPLKLLYIKNSLSGEVIEKDEFIEVKIEVTLNMAAAALTLAHELSHVIYHSSREYKAIKGTANRQLADEYQAYFQENLILKELLEIPSFKSYSERYEADPLQGIKLYLSQEIQNILIQHYTLDAQLVKAYLLNKGWNF